MKWLSCIPRSIKILYCVLRYLVNRKVISRSHPVLRAISYLNPFSYLRQHTRGAALRLCLESLGPIFIKFGQLLSIRGDLFEAAVIRELEQLQDNVTPFSSTTVIHLIEKQFKQPIDQLFAKFDSNPLGSASIAQVHAATLHNGDDIILKVLRPKIHNIIQRDIVLMHLLAFIIKHSFKYGKLMHPTEIVQEFQYTIHKELNLELEAASASQLKENFQTSSLLYVPKIHWQFTCKNILAMERIHGVRINDIETLKKHNTNFKMLAENGVEIFFTQLLRDSFFHADMHPGNLFIDISNPNKPKYMAVDFGIMGTLNAQDQRYIGENLLAFFHRDYRRIAELHVESGWVPADTKIDHFTASIRSVAEPIFQKPLERPGHDHFLHLGRRAGLARADDRVAENRGVPALPGLDADRDEVLGVDVHTGCNKAEEAKFAHVVHL